LLRRLARQELSGVGDTTKGEWGEVTSVAYHLRRRISDKEENKIGPAIDIRGTKEEAERLNKMRFFLG
jgi:hypothetical protein